MERNRDLLKRGTVLVDPDDPGQAVRTLFYLEHTIQDGRTDKAGNRRVASRQLQFVETDSSGVTRNAGYAPYLDYRPTTPEERTCLTATLESQDWLTEERGPSGQRIRPSRVGDWTVCWLGGWSRHRLYYLLMLVRRTP